MKWTSLPIPDKCQVLLGSHYWLQDFKIAAENLICDQASKAVNTYVKAWSMVYAGQAAFLAGGADIGQPGDSEHGNEDRAMFAGKSTVHSMPEALANDASGEALVLSPGHNALS